jgi:hypothetical protein
MDPGGLPAALRSTTAKEAPDRRLVNGQTRKPFARATDLCVERGVRVGHDAEALAAARRA